MAYPMGEADEGALRLDFDRRLMLQFRGSTITSDAGLLAYRELDDALHLTDTAADALADVRTGKNGRHRLGGLLRQSVFGRLAGYEDVNDAERLCHDPAMRWVVGARAISGSAASASQMGRFETTWLSRPENLAALADLSGQWIDKVRRRREPKIVMLDMDSSESPTPACAGAGSMANRKAVPTTGISAAPAITRSSGSTSSAMSNVVCCGRATCIVPMIGVRCWSR
jgi:Transposase DDE domain group 1